MNIIKRLFNIGRAEAHEVVEKLEDPIKMTEQGIRDMEKDLEKSLKALAEVRVFTNRSRSGVSIYKSRMSEYENKAVLLLKKAQEGRMSMDTAELLAGEALAKKAEYAAELKAYKSEYERFSVTEEQLDKNVAKLRRTITKWKNELITLKARLRVSQATRSLNQQIAEIDSNSTISMLENMRDQVAEEEALAQSYAEIGDQATSIDDEIDRAIGGQSVETMDELERLKNRHGIS